MDFEERHSETVNSAAKACWENNPEALQEILAKGGRVDVSDNQGWFPLHVAAHCGSTACLELVLDAMNIDDSLSIDVDVKTYDDKTALMLAAAVSVECVQLLAIAGADATVRTPLGFSALHAAVAADSLDLLDAVLEAGAEQLETPAGGPGRLAPVVESGDEPYPLLSAALDYGAGLPVLKNLLEAGASLSTSNWLNKTPLMVAAEHFREDAVDLFLFNEKKTQRAPWLLEYRKFGPLHVMVKKRLGSKGKALVDSLLNWCGSMNKKNFNDMCHNLMECDARDSCGEFLDVMARNDAVRTASFQWLVDMEECLIIAQASYSFLEVFLQHADILVDDISFWGILELSVRVNRTRERTMMTLLLLQDTRCQKWLTQPPEVWQSGYSIPFMCSASTPRLAPPHMSLLCARRYWKTLGVVHDTVRDDRWLKERYGLPLDGSTLHSVGIAYYLVRGFSNRSIVSELGNNISFPLSCKRLLLQLCLQATTERISVSTAYDKKLPADLVSQVPSLLVIARSAIYEQLRVCRVPKMASAVAEVAGMLPAGLRRVLTMQDPHTIDLLRQMFDTSEGSDWTRHLKPEEPWNFRVKDGDSGQQGPSEVAEQLWKEVSAWERADSTDGLW